LTPFRSFEYFFAKNLKPAPYQWRIPLPGGASWRGGRSGTNPFHNSDYRTDRFLWLMSNPSKNLGFFWRWKIGNQTLSQKFRTSGGFNYNRENKNPNHYYIIAGVNPDEQINVLIQFLLEVI